MIVKVWGPAYMKNRPAFQFRNTLVIYNFIQVVFSTWLFYEVRFPSFYLFFKYKSIQFKRGEESGPDVSGAIIALI